MQLPVIVLFFVTRIDYGSYGVLEDTIRFLRKNK